MPKKKPGPKTLAEMTGEPTEMVKIMVTETQKQHVSNQGMSLAAYLRKLIDTDMALKGVGVDPEEVNTDVLKGLEMIIQSLQSEVAR